MATTTIELGASVEAKGAAGTRRLLIGAPLLMALGRLLLVPLDEQDWGGTMTSMAASQARSDTGWLLVVASGLLAVTAVILANRLRLAGSVRSAFVRRGHDRDRVGGHRGDMS